MSPGCHIVPSAFFRKFHIILLAFAIVLGLMCGIVTAHSCKQSFSSLMENVSCDVSAIGHVTILVFPLLFMFFSVYKPKWYFLFPLCFIHFFLFTYCAWGLTAAIGCGGWLFSFLYLFSGYMILPLELWFMIRCITEDTDVRIRDIGIYLCVLCLIFFLDHHFISPLLIVMT